MPNRRRFGSHPVWPQGSLVTSPDRNVDRPDPRQVKALAVLGHEIHVPHTDRTSSVYFIRCGDYVKIGTTRMGAARRFAGMQLPPNAELVAEVQGWGQVEERRLHDLFHSHRVGGEWFESCVELEALISANRY